MNYAQIRRYDVANGIGIRTSLFVSGCHFNCPGCFNKEYQDFKYGNEYSYSVMQNFVQLGKDENVMGYSILGGEPLDQTNDDMLFETVKSIKKQTGKSIWLWTGFLFEELNEKQLEIIKNIDVLVDGQFIEDKKNLKLLFRGSENQRIIDVQKSLINDKVILWENI